MNFHRGSLATLLAAACFSGATGYAQDLRSTEEYVPDQVIIRINQAQYEELAFVEHMIGATGHKRLFQQDIWLLAFAILIWAFVDLGCLRGSIGQNKYGPDPLAPDVLTPPVRTHA